MRPWRWGPRRTAHSSRRVVGARPLPCVSPKLGSLDSRGSGCHRGKGEETWRPLPSYPDVKSSQKDLSALDLPSPKFPKA